MAQITRPALTAPVVRKALAYARVSTKEQEKEGFSIPAQQKLLASYAEAHGLRIVGEYVDVETAKQSGRTNFQHLVRYLKSHTDVKALLVEKTDRLYRNFKDWVTLDELNLEIHLVKEGTVLSQESKSAEKFVHGIKVLMAKNYIDNLSEEARKGQLEKASQGFWPTKAPLGYRNVTSPEGRRIIVPDETVAPIITRLFGWYSTGTVSLKEVAERARAEGLIYRRTGAAVPVSTIHMVLHNRLYTGDVPWKGRIYKGHHKALVDLELWERVQTVLNGRGADSGGRHALHNFAFSGLMSCGHCGCAMVGEIKKGRYTYYHCTGYRGKCPEKYVREEVISAQFSALLKRLDIGGEVLGWVTTALRESHADQQKAHLAAIAKLQAEYDRLQQRLHGMYLDKLDGRVEAAFYDKMADDWRQKQERCMRDIARHQAADQSYLDEGVRLLELAQSAQQMFETRPPNEQRRLLNFVVSNSTWKNGQLTASLRQPFDLIAKTAAIVGEGCQAGCPQLPGHPAWLGDQDSNLD